MRSAARRIAPWALGSLGLLLFAVTAQAQTLKSAPAPRPASIDGADTFRTYCAVCHGPQGKGNGPAAAVLKTVPADLTTIAKRRGKFSVADMEDWILGKRLTPAHGNREMPIWGPVFRAVTGDDSVTTLLVANLINHLQKIQAP